MREAIGSLPKGTPYLIAENDGDLAGALNEALRAVETEFVFRLDADDVLVPPTLQILEGACWDVDVAYPSTTFVMPDLVPFEYANAQPFCPNRLLVKNHVPSCALFRPEKALAVGGYRDMEILEDWDLWVRMSRVDCRFKAVPEGNVFYRQHDDQRNKRLPEDHARVKAEATKLIVGAEPELAASFYYQSSYATTYWRCLLPARWLPGQAVNHAAGMRWEDDEGVHVDFSEEHRGAAVFQFPGDGTRAIIMAEMQEQGIRVLVESDDNYFDTSPLGNPGWVKTLKPTAKELKDPNRRGHRHSLEAHRKIVPWADGCIVTTEQLAKRYRDFNKNVFVCPNQIDPDDWPEPQDPLVGNHFGWERDDGVCRVGWFAGPSHGRDAPLVRGALEWASKQPNVQVVTMGFDPHWNFDRLHIPWSNDAGVYRRVIGWLDVGLAPVVETPWSVCRSDLKALEYGVAGAAPVVSDAIPYKGYSGPCLRAKTPRDFLRHVQHLVTNPDEARMLARSAREFVLKERTMKQNIWRWEEAIDGGRARRAVA